MKHHKIRQIYGRLSFLAASVAILISYYFLLYSPLTEYLNFPDSGFLLQITSTFNIFLSLAVGVVGYFFLPGAVGFLLSLPVALLWKRPSKILLLRKFQRGDRSKALSRAANRYISPFGHVYTLSDRDIYTRWYIRLPVLFAQFVFLHFRERTIDSSLKLSKLEHSIKITWLRNINWAVSWNKLFPIRCSDTVWQACVEKVSDHSNLIIIDISLLTDNLVWEISRCKEYNLTEKLVFLTTQSAREESEIFVNQQGLNSVPLVCYDTDEITGLPDILASLISEKSPVWNRDRQQPITLAPGNTTLLSLQSLFVMLSPFLWLPVAYASLFTVMGYSVTTADRFIRNEYARYEFRKEALQYSQQLGRTDLDETSFENLLSLYNMSSGTIAGEPAIEVLQEITLPYLKQGWVVDQDNHSPILNFIENLASPEIGEFFWLDTLARDNPFDSPENFNLALDGIVEFETAASVPELIALLNSNQIKTSTDEQLVSIKQRGLSFAYEYAGSDEQVALLDVVTSIDGEGTYPYITVEYAESVIPLLARYWDSLEDLHTSILNAIAGAKIADAQAVWEKALADPAQPEYERNLDTITGSIRNSPSSKSAVLVLKILANNLELEELTETQASQRSALIALAGQLKIKDALTELLGLLFDDSGNRSRADRDSSAESITRIFDSYSLYFVSEKPLITLATLGNVNTGKTTLTAALTRYFALDGEVPSYLDDRRSEPVSGISTPLSPLPFESTRSYYKLFDIPGHPDFIKRLTTGTLSFDTGIVVEDASNPLARVEVSEQLALAALSGIEQMVGFINKTDLVNDPELIELIGLELEELLDEYGYPNAPIIYGSALLALNNPGSPEYQESLEQLIAGIESLPGTGAGKNEMPTVFSIKYLDRIQDKAVLVGKVVQGTITAGQEYAFVSTESDEIIELETCFALTQELSPVALPNNIAACTLDSDAPSFPGDGNLITSPGTIDRFTKYELDSYIVDTIDGGRLTPFFQNAYFEFNSGYSVFGTVQLPDGTEMAMPGENISLTITLDSPVPAFKGMRVAIRRGGKTIGAGIISETIE